MVMKIGSSLTNAMKSSVAAMKAEGERFLVISQNMANSETLPSTPGGQAYQRQTISFKTHKDRDGVSLVTVNAVGKDSNVVNPLYMPEHPGANEQGFVNQPNVNPLIESTDARQSNLNYLANMNVMQKILNMMQETVNILK